MKTLGIVSGYFNPIHQGHIEYITAAREQCDYLVVIINNDDQVKIKNSVPFMDEQHRQFIVTHLKSVDSSVISVDEDDSVCESIKTIHKGLHSLFSKIRFFNSGDRVGDNKNKAEYKLCEELGIEYVTLELPKLYSSTELIEEATKFFRKS